MEPPNSVALKVTPSWFQTRPIPVFIILVWCVLQFVGTMLFLSEPWAAFVYLVKIGAVSPFILAAKILYPFFLLLAGLLLFFMRKGAIIIFGLYMAWGVTKSVSQHLNILGHLSLVLVFGIIIYCLRLAQKGLLK